jgi:hypothetical protein
MRVEAMLDAGLVEEVGCWRAASGPAGLLNIGYLNHRHLLEIFSRATARIKP